MRKTAYILLASALFLGSVSFAFAFGAQPGSPTTPFTNFGFYCGPYTTSFVSGNAYAPDSSNPGNVCNFQLTQQDIPVATSSIFLAVYKGTPSNATLTGSFGFGPNPPDSNPVPYSLLNIAQNGITGAPGDNFFSVAVPYSDFNDALAANTYFQSGGTAPAVYDILSWKWGTPLTITANSFSINQGDAIPPLTATLSGFNAPDTAMSNNVSGAANCTTTATGSNTPGDYPINCTQGSLTSATYSFAPPLATYIAGNLHIAASATDTQPPAITINTPQNGHSYLQNDVASIDATITDASALGTTTYTLDGNPVDQTQVLPFASLPLGTNVLVVSASDIYGNVGYATSTFTLLPGDYTAPTITITSPVSGATYTDTSNVVLTATITDASAIAATSSTFTDNAGNTTSVVLGQPLPLLGAALGPASVSVTAADAYGNVSVATVNFTIKSSDVTPPTIVITNPIAGHTYLSTDSVVAAATITDASGVANSSYTLNGMSIADPTQPLPLGAAGAGPAKLVVTATDNFGNIGSSSVSFIIVAPPPPDTQPPVIIITSPANGKKYSRDDSVKIVASITDASAIANVRYLFNGKPVDPTKLLNFSTAPLGTATLVITATDAFGNKGAATSTFRILPGSNSCLADITDAFDHKWISNKNDFKAAFDDCQKINDRGNDRDNYGNDDNNHHKDPNTDNRYLQCNQDIDNAFSDIDNKIHN